MGRGTKTAWQSKFKYEAMVIVSLNIRSVIENWVSNKVPVNQLYNTY